MDKNYGMQCFSSVDVIAVEEYSKIKDNNY